MAFDYDWDVAGDGEPIWLLNEAGQHAARIASDYDRKVLYGGHVSIAEPSGQAPAEEA
jgi:hypothetical protein